MGKELEYRWSEKNFRRYEGILTAFIATFPLDVFVQPFPYSLETVRCRCADAARAFCHNRWPSTCDPDKLKDLWPLAAFGKTTDGTHLVLHPNARPYGREITPETIIHRIVDPLDTLGEPIAPSQPSGIVISNPNIETLRALFFLHNLNHIPVQSKLTELSPDSALYIKTQQEFLNIGHMFLDPVTAIIT